MNKACLANQNGIVFTIYFNENTYHTVRANVYMKLFQKSNYHYGIEENRKGVCHCQNTQYHDDI